MQDLYSSRVIPSADRLLRERVGRVLSSLTGLRLKSYLRRPGRLITDGWRLNRNGDSLSYSIGSTRYGQELSINRRERLVTLKVFCPDLTQEIQMDIKSSEIVLNRIDFEGMSRLMVDGEQEGEYELREQTQPASMPSKVWEATLCA